MVNIWLIADTHFGHEATWARFKRLDGSPLRPFSSTAEMDEAMITRWNETVKPSDHVYHLGDVVIAKPHLQTIGKLHGHKRLVRGNHDIYKTWEYVAAGFEEIYGVRVFDKAILSHVPLFRESITQRFHANIHGHLHANDIDDPKYLCVSVEHTDYRPIHLEDAYKLIADKQLKLSTTFSGKVVMA